MQQFLGEYDCKVDAKGRLRLPTPLLRQFGGAEKQGFVVNRGFEKCLVLYPNAEWQKITKEINALNLFVKKHREFVRYFYRGATEMMIDTNDRILLPKRLTEYATIDKELVLFAYFNRIEIWSKELYDNFLDDEPSDFASLAEDVMGKALNNPNEGDVS